MSFNFVPAARVEVPEIPYRPTVTLPADKTAIIVVDMQNDFVKSGGSLQVASAMETLPGLQSLLSRGRRAGARIAYTQDTHYDGDREWEIWPPHCKAESWGWRIVDELAPAADDLVCQKSRYDGFYDTTLDHYLTRVWKVAHLVIVGTVSSICVAHTAASAGLRWFHIVAPADGMSAMTEFDQALTLRQISFLYLGDVVKSLKDIHFE